MAVGGLYIKKAGSQTTVDTTTAYGVYVAEMPYLLLGEAKELPSNNWHDEHGDDEYIPSVLMMEAQEVEFTFAYKGDLSTASSSILSFIDFLRGADGTGAEFSWYDPYWKIGRQATRYMELDDDAEYGEYEEGGTKKCMVKFKVTLKVNDPVTRITLTI